MVDDPPPSPRPSPSGRGRKEALTPTLSLREREKRGPHPDPLPPGEGEKRKTTPLKARVEHFGAIVEMPEPVRGLAWVDRDRARSLGIDGGAASRKASTVATGCL